MKNNSFKHTITLTFVTEVEVNPAVLDRIMFDAAAQLETLADDYDIDYKDHEACRDFKIQGTCKVCLEVGCKGCSLP